MGSKAAWQPVIPRGRMDRDLTLHEPLGQPDNKMILALQGRAMEYKRLSLIDSGLDTTRPIRLDNKNFFDPWDCELEEDEREVNE